MYLKDKRVVIPVCVLLTTVLVFAIYSTYFSQSKINSIPSSAHEDSEHVKPQPNKLMMRQKYQKMWVGK